MSRHRKCGDSFPVKNYEVDIARVVTEVLSRKQKKITTVAMEVLSELSQNIYSRTPL